MKESNWEKTGDDLNSHGYAVLPAILNQQECQELIANYSAPNRYRKTITMARYRFGLGEYKYFQYPLPSLISDIRITVYPFLAQVANQWMEKLRIETRYPSQYTSFRQSCHDNKQIHPTVLILKYGEGGFNTLHQDLYGDIYFPLQLVLFLDEPGLDYRGGEFVMTEQVPRAQSRAMVVQPRRGDMLLFTTNFRPVKSTKGYYRAAIKHGVSRVTEGNRHTLGIIFHDALS